VCSLKYKAYLAGYECSVIIYVVNNGALITELRCEFSVIVCSLKQETYPCELGYKDLIII
jgi:hypothetical protein